MNSAMIGTDEIAARLTKARADRTAIGSLSASFNRMRRSLQNAMSMLEEQS